MSRASSAVSTGKVVKSRHISGLVPGGASYFARHDHLDLAGFGIAAGPSALGFGAVLGLAPVLGLAIVAFPNETATRAVPSRAPARAPSVGRPPHRFLAPSGNRRCF